MLQIHPHAQLAHWAVVTLTTVEDRCGNDNAPHEVSLIGFSNSVYFLEKKNHLTKSQDFDSSFYPIHVMLES
jgi:hypothetical protein